MVQFSGYSCLSLWITEAYYSDNLNIAIQSNVTNQYSCVP